MATAVSYATQAAFPSRILPGLQLVLGLAVFVALSLPVLLAEPGPLTSDESLSVSEALNLAEGRGFTYPNGDPVVHRGPVFPAILAADIAIAGYSLDGANWVPRLFVLANAALLLLLGWRLFGREAGLLAGALALASAFLGLMGTRLFLDGTETFFLLSMLLFTHLALKEGEARWAALSGAALGLAMLTKESALLWVPLPLLAALLLGRAVDRPRTLLAAYAAGFLIVAGWWWPYVYATTGHVYLLGAPGQAALWLSAVALGVVGATAIAFGFARQGPATRFSPNARWLIVGFALAGWAALFILGLERYSAWPFPSDYLRTLPDYTSTVLFSWLRPLPLIGIAWAYVAYRAARGALSDRLVLLALLLFLPFALVVANRGLHLRDMLPLVYLSYLALGRAAIDFGRWIADAVGENSTPTVGGAVAGVLLVGGFAWFALSEAQHFEDFRGEFDAGVVSEGHWDNPLTQDVAAWIGDNVSPGTPIMSGRLYYSHLYTLTGGDYPWWQLPTVRVDFEGSPASPVRAGTLFRWADHRLPDGPAEPWLYLRRIPTELYYVALSEQDLLADLQEHDIGYVVVTGDDAGFSSLSLVTYFEEHPAFQPVQSFIVDGGNQAHIFQVVPSLLIPAAPPAFVSASTAIALADDLGAAEAQALLEGLSPGGYELAGSGAAGP